MIVLDTNILAYALGGVHPLRDNCRRLLDAVADGRVAASTTPEVIQEFVHVRAKRRERQRAAREARDYAELLSPLLTVGLPDLQRGLSLFARHPNLDAADAVLAAVALRAEADALASADAAFAAVRGLTHLEPRDPELERLLSG